MTAPKRGDRVHVEYDATYLENLGNEHELLVGNGMFEYVAPEYATFTVLPPVVKVGDVLTVDSPEPPFGTSVIEDEYGIVAQRGREAWHVAGGMTRLSWHDLIRSWGGTARVVWVKP